MTKQIFLLDIDDTLIHSEENQITWNLPLISQIKGHLTQNPNAVVILFSSFLLTYNWNYIDKHISRSQIRETLENKFGIPIFAVITSQSPTAEDSRCHLFDETQYLEFGQYHSSILSKIEKRAAQNKDYNKETAIKEAQEDELGEGKTAELRAIKKDIRKYTPWEDLTLQAQESIHILIDKSSSQKIDFINNQTLYEQFMNSVARQSGKLEMFNHVIHYCETTFGTCEFQLHDDNKTVISTAKILNATGAANITPLLCDFKTNLANESNAEIENDFDALKFQITQLSGLLREANRVQVLGLSLGLKNLVQIIDLFIQDSPDFDPEEHQKIVRECKGVIEQLPTKVEDISREFILKKVNDCFEQFQKLNFETISNPQNQMVLHHLASAIKWLPPLMMDARREGHHIPNEMKSKATIHTMASLILDLINKENDRAFAADHASIQQYITSLLENIPKQAIRSVVSYEIEAEKQQFIDNITTTRHRIEFHLAKLSTLDNLKDLKNSIASQKQKKANEAEQQKKLQAFYQTYKIDPSDKSIIPLGVLLRRCAAAGDLVGIKWVLEIDRSLINSKGNKDGRTALHWCMVEGSKSNPFLIFRTNDKLNNYIECVKFLLEKGALSIEDKAAKLPLELAHPAFISELANLKIVDFTDYACSEENSRTSLTR